MGDPPPPPLKSTSQALLRAEESGPGEMGSDHSPCPTIDLQPLPCQSVSLYSDHKLTCPQPVTPQTRAAVLVKGQRSSISRLEGTSSSRGGACHATHTEGAVAQLLRAWEARIRREEDGEARNPKVCAPKTAQAPPTAQKTMVSPGSGAWTRPVTAQARTVFNS